MINPKVLLISSNTSIIFLYLLNLEIYLNAETIVVDFEIEARKLLNDKNKKIDLVIIEDNDSSGQLVDSIAAFLAQASLNIPIIVLGTPSQSMAQLLSTNVVFTQSKYEIKKTLSKAAKFLNITAKDMANLNVGEYYNIHTSYIEEFKLAPCTFYKLSKNTGQKPIIVISENQEITPEYISSLGLSLMAIKSEERLKLTNKISSILAEKVGQKLLNVINLDNNYKTQALKDAFDFGAANLFQSEEARVNLQKLATNAGEIMNAVSNDAKGLKSLIELLKSNKSGYIFTHSMIVSYVATCLIKAQEWGNHEQIEKLNFVLFFHDIFLVPLYQKYPELEYEADAATYAKLTPKEVELINNHAQLAAEEVTSYKRCPMGADTIIKQHHGKKSGRGFAENYPKDLSPLARVIIISESFVELFLSAKKQNRTFEIMQTTQILTDKFSSPEMKKIIDLLSNVKL